MICYLVWKQLQRSTVSNVDVAVAATVSGDDATGTFTDGTVFTATGESDYISVNVDDGTCVGSYYVSHVALLHDLNSFCICGMFAISAMLAKYALPIC